MSDQAKDERTKHAERMSAFTNLAVCGMMLCGTWLVAPIFLAGGSVLGSGWMVSTGDLVDDIPWFKLAGVGALGPLLIEASRRIRKKYELSRDKLGGGEWYQDYASTLVHSNWQDDIRQEIVLQHQQDTSRQDSGSDGEREERVLEISNIVALHAQQPEGPAVHHHRPKKRRQLQ